MDFYRVWKMMKSPVYEDYKKTRRWGKATFIPIPRVKHEMRSFLHSI